MEEKFKQYISQIERCRSYGSTNLKFEKTPNLIHYGRLDCGNCKSFVAWVKNPESPRANSLRINKKTISEVCDFHKIQKDICFFCLRERNQLGEKETLTIDHIVELDRGGFDEIQNMQVLCSACHKLKNWARLYMNWHYIPKLEGEKRDDTTKTSN